MNCSVRLDLRDLRLTSSSNCAKIRRDGFWLLNVYFHAGLFSAEMAASMESRELTMSVNQSPSLHEQFSSPEQIRSSGRSYSDLEILLREFGHAQAWHRYRGRPELTEQYSRIGRALREVLRESLTILKPKEAA